MNETASDLAGVQRLLDSSAAGGRRHLTGIVGPSRRLSAKRLCADLRGVLVLNVATVSASGAPRLSAVAGHFLHGQWYFSTAAAAVKARHLFARAQISVGYTPRDGYGVWVRNSVQTPSPKMDTEVGSLGRSISDLTEALESASKTEELS